MLNKLYYVFGVDTGCFYTNDEAITDYQLNCFRQLKTHIKNNQADEDENKYEKSAINECIKVYKDKLKQQITDNINTTRTARLERFYNKSGEPTLSKRISIFDSVLTRAFGLRERQFNDEIMVIKVYYFDIAHSIIRNGFYLNGKKYVFFSSSAGQIRTKKLVAVREDLLRQCWNSLTAGLSVEEINNHGGMNVNKYLAYLALCNSATDEWGDFNIDRCIVVDDFENTVTGEVDFIDDKTFEITRKTEELPFTQTDGCGLISPELSKKNFMVRLPWVKGLLAVFDFKKFIAEHGCSPIVTDIYGDKHNIIEDNIQIILTKSQFKMYKYFFNWQQYKENFKKYNCTAGICNMEEDVFPNSVINYQMIQTLSDMTDKEIQSLAHNNDATITNMSSNPKKMLEVFGATRYNKDKNGFQNCLLKYPELLGDLYCRQTLKEIKNKLEVDLWSARFDIGGKYTFVIPDLYAFCEYLFLHEENPNGVLADGEVSCKLFKADEKLDCLRSPHLYIEHPIRINKPNIEWFETNAIYISCHDFISRVVQCDE